MAAIWAKNFCFLSYYFVLFVPVQSTSHFINLEGSSTDQSSTSNNHVASYAVDGDNNTCSNTTKQQNAYWMVDLGKVAVITKVNVIPGPIKVSYGTRIFISTAENEHGDACGMFASNLLQVNCSQPKRGRYVRLMPMPRQKKVINICEISFEQCDPGFYGLTCENECHCSDGDICEKVAGRCPNQCDLGWQGISCDEGCDDGYFGHGCVNKCFCTDGPCNKRTGECNGPCQQNYHGDTCQTETPTLATEMPRVTSSKADSLLVEWPSWDGPMSPDATLSYRVNYVPHHTSSTIQNVTLNRTMSAIVNAPTQSFLLTELAVNVRYIITVEPYIKLNNIEITGIQSEKTPPVKTKCAVPSYPRIEGTYTGANATEPPVDTYINITWLASTVSNCDSLYYYIMYRQTTDNANWQRKAIGDATSYQINGLKDGAEYMLRIVAVNNEQYNSSSDITVIYTDSVQGTALSISQDVTNAAIITAVGVAVLIVLIIIIVCVIYRRRKLKYNAVPIEERKNEKTVTDSREMLGTDLDSGVGVDGSGSEVTPVSAIEPIIEPVLEATPTPKMPEVTSKVIAVEELEDYVLGMHDDDRQALRKEYQEIPMGLISTHDIGKKKDNKFKNRFVNIIAYDHSRVVLDEIPGDAYSDYINANYVDGYSKPQHYVAAQGCNKYTLQDMWRMSWQLKSAVIIMVTNLVENGKRKCDQYWPSTGEKTYGDIAVRFLDIEETSDFVIRSFQLTKDGETQSVKQFHFIAWPDHGVPTRAGPILAFRHKVRSFISPNDGPVIIHCSAGVGRTGTFIALDYLLEQAEAENVVDIYGIVCKMRLNRVNMIQTVEQYLFVYDALLDALKSGNTSMSCSTFRDEYKKLLEIDEETGKSQLQVQFETLQSMTPVVKDDDCASGLQPENQDKNRDPKILPADRHRPYLMIRVDGTNDYINAVFLDGYRKRNSYIITQMPMGHTVIDFWRMIYEHNCQSVIMLNPVDSNESYGHYWLDDEVCDCGPFVIEPVSVDNANPNITIREHKVTYEPQSPSLLPKRKDEPRVCGQFELTCWNDNQSTPTSITAMVALIDLVERHQQKTGDGPVVIHCRDGVSHSGLFAAVSCILEKMKLEQEIDIFHTIKQLRFYRPQIISDLEQYKFCHEVVLTYLAEFETYANFR